MTAVIDTAPVDTPLYYRVVALTGWDPLQITGRSDDTRPPRVITVPK